MSKCLKCGEEVLWKEKPGGGFFPPENRDGSRHDCEKRGSAKPAAPPQQQKEDSMIGTYRGLGKGRISILRRDKRILSSAATTSLLNDLSDPACQIKIGMKVKVTFDKKGDAAEKIEVCPDQPAPVVQQPAATKPPVQPVTPPKETCTSPSAAPAPSEKDVWAAEREEFCTLLTSTGREGMPDLLQYLTEETDFFIAPSSTKYHDARDGGLLHHSLKTYRNLIALSGLYAVEIPEGTSLAIIALLHDVCKVNIYKLERKSLPRRNDKGEIVLDDWGKKIWDETMVYTVDDQYPLGHGEKSVIILQRYIRLTDTEIFAIRWHMMAYDDSRNSYAGNLAITNASDKYRIIPLFHMADLAASFLEMRPADQPGGA
jgi:hypothetical protein